jgi:1,2-dihydroxy-3-keto-5-methylthiopentene dioxygenase
MAYIEMYELADPARLRRTLTEPAEMAPVLAAFGVSHEAWPVRALPADGANDVVMDVYREELTRLFARGGYKTADVVRMTPDHPQKDALRAKFRNEHTHAEDEVRYFVEGSGAFYLRDDARVAKVVCSAGDLLNVPAGVRHWFDAGEAPHFTAIRIFCEPAGWVADFTGDSVAEQVP